MKPSEAFLHPRRTARLVEELEDECGQAHLAAETLRREKEEAVALRETAEAEIMELREAIAGHERSQQQLMNLLLTTRTELESRILSLRQEIEQTRTEEETLREINTQIERMRQSQQNYRQRIASLKAQLAEARAETARLAGKRTSGLREPIEMEETESAASGDGNNGHGSPEEATDWLLPLP